MTASAQSRAEAGKREADNGQGHVTDRLRSEFQNLVGAMGDRAVRSVRDSVGGITERLTDYADGPAGGLATAVKGARDITQGKSPARAILNGGIAALKGKASRLLGGGAGKGKTQKMTTVLESVDVGVPVHVAYNQWTRFTEFPRFMKKVESVEQESDEKLKWKAQILWSHRSWDATILQQVPDEKIVWRSRGQKGYVDGAVTFHEMAPNLTRVLMALEYHPQGFFEHTGNLWRAQGRRARLELKHFQRYVMTDVIMHADEVEGWRGVIEDGSVRDQRDEPNRRSGRDSGEHNGRNQDIRRARGRSESSEQAPRSKSGTRPGTRPASRSGSRSGRSERSGGTQDQGKPNPRRNLRRTAGTTRETSGGATRRRGS